MEIVKLISSNIKKVDIGKTCPAVCISGGVDSTVVLYHVVNDLMNGIGSNVYTFTVTFGNDYDEGEKAKKVADFYGTIHIEVRITKIEIISWLPFVLQHYPFPRFNIWPWIAIDGIRQWNFPHLFIGEGSDELFGYPDRSFLEGWAGQLVWVFPSWKIPCDYYGIELHTPFMEIQNGPSPVTEFYLAPDKELLRKAYCNLLPEFVLKQSSTPPSHGFYKMMGMSKKELQLEAAKAWISTR